MIQQVSEKRIIEPHVTDSNAVKKSSSLSRDAQTLLNTACFLLLLTSLIPTASIWLSEISTRNLKEVALPLVASVFLVVGAALYRKPFVAQPRKKSWLGLCFVVLISIALNAAGLFKLFHVMFPLSIMLTAAFVFAINGYARLKTTLPLFFLACFLLPNVPESMRTLLSTPLQNIGAFLTVHFCKLFFPISGTSHYFVISGTSYNVAPSCSGLSMLASFLFAFAIFQLFERPRPLAYVFIFLFDPVMTLTLNTVRLILTALFAYYGSEEFAISVHSNLEFILVPIGLAVLWIAGKKTRVIKEI